MRILIAESEIITSEEYIPRGYIHVEGDTITEIGEGEPPPDLQYAELVIGGRNRLALVGLTSLLLPLDLYPYRSELLGFSLLEALNTSIAERVAQSPSLAYFTALLSIYELISNGFSGAVALTPHPSEAAKAYREVGLDGGLLIPVGCKYSKHKEGKPLFEMIEEAEASVPEPLIPGVFYCRALKQDEVLRASRAKPNTLIAWIEGESLLLAKNGSIVNYSLLEPLALSYSPFILLQLLFWSRRDVEKAARELLEASALLAKTDGKKPGNITIIDTSEPPCLSLNSGLKSLVGCSPRIETVVSRGTILLDAGQLVVAGKSKIESALNTLKSIA